jgi:hypothetical protein
MSKFIKVDFDGGFSSVCDTKEEVMEGCGYDIDEMSFEDFLSEIEGEFDIIEIKGECDLKWLTEE